MYQYYYYLFLKAVLFLLKYNFTGTKTKTKSNSMVHTSSKRHKQRFEDCYTIAQLYVYIYTSKI